MAVLERHPYTTLNSIAALPQDRVEVHLSELCVSDSVRRRVNKAHVQVLSEVEDQWPPILVKLRNGQIIDGIHRYFAAIELGRLTIECDLFDGDDRAAFVEAVRLNVSHGLPLSLRERQDAARRVLTLYREWSDRKIAGVCGLSANTVRKLRDCSTASVPQLNRRQGIDGRIRPVDAREARRRTREAIDLHPKASLREIARIVGVSPATVGKVKRDYQPPLKPGADYQDTGVLGGPPKQTETSCSHVTNPRPHGSEESALNHCPKRTIAHATATQPAENNLWTRVGAASTRWTTDLALMSTPSGEEFCHWFSQTDVPPDDSVNIHAVPLGRIYDIADEARRRATWWTAFALALEHRSSEARPAGL
jgi:ParB-like chromosome segregation protein Spo0J